MTTSLALPSASAGSGIAFHGYAGIDEIPGMGAANARLRRHVGMIEPIDPDAMRHRYTHLVNSDPLVDCLVASRDGVTVGYARVEWHDLTDGDRIYDVTTVVEPDAWDLGITEAFLGWAEARVRHVAEAQPTVRREWYANAVFDGDEELERALKTRGYLAVRWEAEMLRPTLDDLAEKDLPDGYVIRPVAREELPTVFEMQVVSFAEHWGVFEAGEHRLDEWIDDPRFRLDLLVVVWAGAQPAACVSNVEETRDDGSRRLLLEGVCTHPAHRRRGLARAAINHSLRLARENGATSAYLGVDTGNPNEALALYESCGFRKVSGSAAYRKPFEAQEMRP